jgi:hypothetical protein
VLLLSSNMGRTLTRQRRDGGWYNHKGHRISTGDSWYLNEGNRSRYAIRDIRPVGGAVSID